MDESLLYELLETKYLYKYREELEKQKGDNFYKWVKESREKLEKSFDEKQLKMIDGYVNSVALREEHITFLTSIKFLNFGVKIGMQLQKSFDADRE